MGYLLAIPTIEFYFHGIAPLGMFAGIEDSQNPASIMHMAQI